MVMSPKWLFVCAHPDDLEYFSGPLISYLTAHKKKSDSIKVISMTRGQMSALTRKIGSTLHAAKIRTRELLNACKILGTESPKFLGLFDGYVRISREAIDKVKQLISTLNPDIIVVPEPIYTFYHHPDHTRTGKIFYYALKELKQEGFPKIPPLYYYAALVNDFYFPKIPKYNSLVKRALKAHVSQKMVLVQSGMINFLLGIINGRKTPGYCQAIALRKENLGEKQKPVKLSLFRRIIYYLGKILNEERDYSPMNIYYDGTLPPNSNLN